MTGDLLTDEHFVEPQHRLSCSFTNAQRALHTLKIRVTMSPNERNAPPSIPQTSRHLGLGVAVPHGPVQPGVGQSGPAQTTVAHHVYPQRHDSVGVLAR